MLRTVPRLPAVMLAAALSGLLLMLAGPASTATARSQTPAPSDARSSADRAVTVTKVTVHKVDVGARAHHDQNGLGPDLAALPAAHIGGTAVTARRLLALDDAASAATASPERSRAPPR
ncbi:hypothetical protein KV097_09235 [Mumia sp. zg.B17]|uniref:hypothetical protein n=1 Tax=Mumia sp. zg.B17 TaxID=2855446 RepID=UPI001C6EC658|nr:hypothetical protein [Mumia sp. zg.B17]MBW9206126.1 hypothetical protein [Mumia sp. zg.B17]